MRVLLLCRREWLHPRAGPLEKGMHDVFSRVAAQGVHITWLAHQYGGLTAARQAPRTENRDGIEVARLGHAWFYPAMVGLFLRQWERKATSDARFDFAVEVINGYVLGVAEHTAMPVLPLVVRAPAPGRLRKIAGGPVAAVGEPNAQALREAGASPGDVLTLPGFPNGRGDGAAWDALANSVLAALETFAEMSGSSASP